MTIIEMIAMRLGGVPVMRVHRCLQRLKEASVSVNPQALAAHFHAGGRLEALTDALVTAKLLAVPATYDQLAAIDIAIGPGTKEFPSPTDAVRASKTPRAIRLPAKGALEFSTPGKYTWRPWAEATVVVQLDRFIGGGGVDWIASQLRAALSEVYTKSSDLCTARTNAAAIDPAAIAKDTKFRVVTLNISD